MCPFTPSETKPADTTVTSASSCKHDVGGSRDHNRECHSCCGGCSCKCDTTLDAVFQCICGGKDSYYFRNTRYWKKSTCELNKKKIYFNIGDIVLLLLACGFEQASNEEHVIANADGERTTPTVVGYGAEDELVSFSYLFRKTGSCI